MIALRLVTCPQFVWLRGMAATDGDRVVDVRDESDRGSGGWRRDGSILPDLADPATSGVLLALLLAEVPHGVRWRGPVVEGGDHVVSRYLGEVREYHYGSTLGEAVALALLATWELP